jgi:ferredoxin-NADP reductase
MMSTRKERAAAARLAALLETARDLGRDYYSLQPDEMLAAVHRKASALYSTKDEMFAFVEGYTQARAQREAFQRDR